MRYGTAYEQGDILVVPFPFSDMKGTKQRPVLVLSNNEYNRKTRDIVVCGITSNLKETDFCSVLFDNKDLSEGKIPVASRIKIDKIFTLEQNLVKKRIAKVRPNIMKRVKQELGKLLLIK